MFSKLRSANFWIGVIVVLITVRVAERMVPAVKTVTMPSLGGASSSGG